MILVTSNQMRQFDKYTMDSLQVPGIVLMEHAGKAVAQTVMEHGCTRVCVLCGKGNNGGDGWIAARWLKHNQVDVMVYSVADPDLLTGDALKAFHMAVAAEVPYRVADVANPVDAEVVLPDADVYVDALLGTGTARPLEGLLLQAVEKVNQRQCWVVGVDVPTGIDSTTGEVSGTAMRCDVTVCMGQQKLGTAVSPGCFYAGDVHVADIGIEQPPEIPTKECAEAIDAEWVKSRWRRRERSAHKGSSGKLAIAVGSMRGAPVLAGLGAARSGVGLVVLGLPSTEQASPQAPLDFVLRQWETDDDKGHLFHDCSALVIGPGLGRSVESWRSVLYQWHQVGVIDADGLAPALEGNHLGERWVLTPHPKECARLLGWKTEEVQQQRVRAAETLARETGCTVVLKGYHTVIASPGEALLVNLSGNEALATAGTGDVLAGVIGSLLAQGYSPRDAAAMGAWLHGKAGELAAQHLSVPSVMATDVVDNISRAIRLYFDN